MSKPRINPHRELFGIIGSVPNASEVLKEWNAYFRAHGIDASMDFYPTTRANLPERLSEMFHFDRRGYIVGKSLSKTIIPFLDHVKPGARRRGVGFVFNEGGVLRGLKNRPPDPQIADLGGSPRYHCPRGNPADINLTSAENHSPQK